MSNTNIPISTQKGPVADPILVGLAAGWRVTDCARLTDDLVMEADVVIVGSGAGGGVTAEILARSGLRVLMGGCAMSADEWLGVTDADGRYRGLRNVSVHEGSLFPTSIGANPQLSVYGVTARLANTLASELTRK